MTFLSPQWSLIAGVTLALALPYNKKREELASKYSSKILKISVILMGATLNFHSVIGQGAKGIGVTFISILFVFTLGAIGMKWLKIEQKQGLLITMGTAICGGSAIGALAPILAAEGVAIAIAMAVVFILNALAIYLFPLVGEVVQLSQEQFGLWSAISIHDTSSVVAAASIYGATALEVAATIKLTRALWIIPIALIFSMKMKKQQASKLKLPWFIAGFLILSLSFTFLEMPLAYKSLLNQISKLGFSLTLFLIGLTFSLDKIKATGLKPFLFGLFLWAIISCTSLALIKLA